MTSRTTNKLNIAYLAFAILWPLVRSQYLGGIDGAGRMLILLMVIAVAVNGIKLFKAPKLTFVWLIWIVYSVFNSKIKGYSSDVLGFPSWAVSKLLFPFISMLVAVRSTKMNYKGTIRALFIVYIAYLILGSVGMAAQSSYDVGTRYENELGNEFLNNGLLLGFYASMLYADRRTSTLAYYTIVAFLSFVILLSGERKGLIALFIIIFGSLYGMNRNKGKKAIVYLCLIFLSAGAAAFVLMRYTTFGMRMTESFVTSQFDDSLFLKLMGDRGIQYYQGWNLFVDNIWTGIGLTNFRWENTFMEGLPFHTEYMVQLCECGIVGALLFLLFYCGIAMKEHRLLKYDPQKTTGFVTLSAFIALIVINLVAWTYDCAYYFILYGVIMGYYEDRKRKNKDLRTLPKRKKIKKRKIKGHVAKLEHAGQDCNEMVCHN